MKPPDYYEVSPIKKLIVICRKNYPIEGKNFFIKLKTYEAYFYNRSSIHVTLADFCIVDENNEPYWMYKKSFDKIFRIFLQEDYNEI